MELRTTETLSAIRNHFLILLSLILADIGLKLVLHVSGQSIDEDAVKYINAILSTFLVFVVFIFTLFAGTELVLYALKNILETVTRLFPGKKVAEAPSPIQGIEHE